MKQNGAVPLSTTVSDESASMEAFVPISLLIPFVEQHPEAEARVMVVDHNAIIHTGDWYYDMGVRSVWRTDVDRAPIGILSRAAMWGVIDTGADGTISGDELPADIQGRCHYSDGLDPPNLESCEENVGSRTVEILMDLNSRARLYVVEANPPHIASTVNWMFDKGADTIHILTDAETLTATISRAYLLLPTEPSLYNFEPNLDIDDAILSQEYTHRHWFSVQDYDLDDHLVYAAASSNRSTATVKYAFGTATSPWVEPRWNPP